MKKVGLISLGCAKNRVDAERILGGLVARGFEIAEDPAEAEVVIVNTCGFIRDAVEESVEEILLAAKLKIEGNCKILAVSGCLYKRYPEMKEELSEVDFFFTPEEIDKIPETLCGSKGAVTSTVHPARLLTAPPHSVYLKIAEGCSNRCTFCTIPIIRGDFHSFPPAKLLEEARWLAGQGAVEVNLIAQDTTSYGLEIGRQGELVKLLKELSAIDGIEWIRLLYAYPRALPDELLELLAEPNKILPYIDAPIQHAHPRILKAMGRKVTAGETAEFFKRLKKQVPGIVLRTTAIVGFPGETEMEFEELLRFVEEVRFHHLGAFVYSPEEGTAAEKMKDQIDPETAWERHDTLMKLQAELSYERNLDFVGRELPVLVEGIDEEGEVVGRTYGQAPEVDGITRLRDYGDRIIEVGSFVKAKIVEAEPYDLVAEVLWPDENG